MSRLLLGAAGAVLLVAAAAAAWPVATPPTAGLAAAPAQVVARVPAAEPLTPPPAPTQPPAACAGARLALGSAPGARTACMGTPRLWPSGDVQAWRAQSMPAGWQLEVELAGDEVLAARLQGPGLQAGCEAAACSGIRLAGRDAHGARTLRLHQALQSADGTAWPVDLAIVLPATDDSAACAAEALALTSDAGAAWRLCPSSTAVARLEDGRRLFHLRSAAGDVLRVGLDAEGALDEIAVGGWQCRQWQCSGATLALQPDGAQALRLDGVALQDPSGPARTALRLQGQVLLPAS